MKKLALLVGLSLLLVACGEVEETKEVAAPVVEKVEKKEPVVAKVVEKKEPVVVEELTVDQKIEKAVLKKLGKKSNLKKKTVESVTYVEADKSATISLNADENFSNNLTKKGIWLNSIEVFKVIEKTKEVDLFTIQWSLPLTDTYGNAEYAVVMSFDISKEELQKINFDNFMTDNVPKVVANYFEHPAFSK